MLGSLIIAILSGVCLGTITGLIPGIHTNLVAIVFGTSLSTLFGGVVSAVTLLSMGVTHTVTSILPNVYLGVCEGDDAVNVLPSHRLVKEGRGGDAVLANVFGGLIAASIGALYFSAATFIVSTGYGMVSSLIPVLLAAALVYLVWRCQTVLIGVLIVCLTGGLGWTVLNSALDHALFPLLSGLFGVPLLVASDAGRLPGEQSMNSVPLSCGRAGLIGSCLGFLTSVLPGVGSGVAASLGVSQVSDEPVLYLSMTGAVDTADFYLSLATLWAAGKARNGVVVVLNDVMRTVSIPVLVVVGVVSVGLAALLTVRLDRIVRSVFDLVPYTLVTRLVVGCLFVVCAFLTGFRGVTVMVVASFLGYLVHRLGEPKIVMMACIIAPVFFFLI